MHGKAREYTKVSQTQRILIEPMTVSLVFPTYNWPEALEMIFLSLKSQSMLPDELVIADDGSTAETRAMIEKYRSQFSVPVLHIWHEDKGYRKTTILNKAIAAASGDYIIQIDGDCIMHRHFIRDHVRAAENRTYLYGSRVNIEEELLEDVIENKRIRFPFFIHGLSRRTRNLHIPVFGKLFKKTKKLSRKIRGCNFSFWRDDFIKANGYNEDMTGWGREDSELVARFINSGILGQRMRYRAIVYHIWHPTRPRDEVASKDIIQERTISEGIKSCENGIDKYLNEAIV